MADPSGRRLLFLVTEDWYFVSHRLHLARAAAAAGYRVAVATRVSSHGDTIRSAGVELIPLELSRRAGNPLGEVVTVLRLLRAWRPHILHAVALKPAVVGTLAALLAGVPRIVNAVSGMGYLFINRTLRARVLQVVVTAAFRLLFGRRRCRMIVQNPDDAAFFAAHGIGRDRIHLIRGSGVDVDAYHPRPEPEGVPVAALVARMLWDKGIGELVAAARLLRDRGVPLRVVLVGRLDASNPRAIDQATLRAWEAEGLVEWWGHRDDVASLWGQCHIAVLPSYREGLPKALLEAAACGRPLVATDVPGCREVVTDGDNGLLVPARQVEPLADALARLAADPRLRSRMGARSRVRAMEEFSDDRIDRETLAVYGGQA